MRACTERTTVLIFHLDTMKQRVKDFFAGIVTATVIEMLLTDAVTELSLNPSEKMALALASLFAVYLFFFHNWQKHGFNRRKK